MYLRGNKLITVSASYLDVKKTAFIVQFEETVEDCRSCILTLNKGNYLNQCFGFNEQVDHKDKEDDSYQPAGPVFPFVHLDRSHDISEIIVIRLTYGLDPNLENWDYGIHFNEDEDID